MILHICRYCYREVRADKMKKQIDGQVSNQCQGCYSVLGGEATMEQEKWFEEIAFRKYMLKRRGKL